MNLKNPRQSFRQLLLGLTCVLLSLSAWAEAGCRMAFDMGSSGVRAGSRNANAVFRADYDYLATWWQKNSLDDAIAPTIAALNQLAQKAGAGADCDKVGGGYSAWRLAAEENAGELAQHLARIFADTGVAVLVIPQRQEGAYGYMGSRQALGDRLKTSHVLDIGGGSLQIAGAQTSFGAALGQKMWHRTLCQGIRQTESSPCVLQPITENELLAARRLLAERLKTVATDLPLPLTLTAISRPVSRAVLPVLGKLAPDGSDREGFSLSSVTRAIDRLASLSLGDTRELSGLGKNHAAYLLSDLILIEGILLATGSEYLNVAEIELTNIPGMLADDRAFAWGRRYACYLDRLRNQGLSAYETDPASCP